MTQIRLCLAAAAFLFTSACAFGPLYNQETGRTVGKRNVEITGGYGVAGYVLKWNAGILDDFDIGLQLESLSVGLRAKYAFIHAREHGFSAAAALGIGSSLGGNHYYGDLIGSYLAGAFEPYGSLRLVHVKTDPIEFKDKDTGDVTVVVDRASYDYGQAFLGSRVWFNKKVYLSIEASKLFAVTKGVKFGDGVLVGAALGARF